MQTGGGARQEDGSEGDDASPASRVRQRYERLFQAREREHDSPRAAAATAAEALAADTAARSAFQGAISSAFVPHLGCAGARRPGLPGPACESFGWRARTLGSFPDTSTCTGQQACMWQPWRSAGSQGWRAACWQRASVVHCADYTSLSAGSSPTLQPGSPARELRQKHHIS